MSDMVSGLVTSFGGPILEELGAKIGLPPAVVKQAVPIVIGLVVTAMMRKTKSAEGKNELAGLIQSADQQVGGQSLTEFIKNADPKKSTELLDGLTGDKSLDNVVGNLSKTTGIPAETCTAAMGTLAPAIVSQISAIAKEKGLDTDGLANLIGEQAGSLGALGGNLDYLLDNTPGIGDDIQRGFKKLFGG
jgi:hypothetical protein